MLVINSSLELFMKEWQTHAHLESDETLMHVK